MEHGQGEKSGRPAVLPGSNLIARQCFPQVPLRLHVKVTQLNGTMRVWVPPPPTDRLWYAFQVRPVRHCRSLGNWRHFHPPPPFFPVAPVFVFFSRGYPSALRQEEPVMNITARPDVGGHQLKYMGVASRVSTWVAARLRTAVTNTLVRMGKGRRRKCR